MNTSSAVLTADRPITSWERARTYAQTVKPPTPSSKPVDVSRALEGNLRDLQRYCDGLHDRLHEPRVGDLLDATRATQGKLYDLRAHIA